MKKSFVLLAMFIVTFCAFSQSETNGTLYIKHPYIDVVDKVQQAYLAQDLGKIKTYYADSAMFWVSGLPEFIPIADAFSMWMNDFKVFDSIKQTPQGYPDYLQYKKEDAKIVQSWWNLSAISKQTGEKITLPIVMFDEFDKDGKITREYIFGDFSGWLAAVNAVEEVELRKVAHELSKALSANDPVALDKLYADKFVFMGDDNVPLPKKERLALLKSGGLHYDKLDMKVGDIKVAGNLAIITFEFLVKGILNGKKLDGRYITAGNFEKQNGKWLEVSAISRKVNLHP